MTTVSKILMGFSAILLSLSISPAANAANPNHVQQLLDTGFCAGCDLTGADLREAHLIGADLRNANLENANLENANLEGADLTGANLEGANLAGTFLNSAELNDANLTVANLENANLVMANLTGANLLGTNLTGVQTIATIPGAQTLEGLSISREPNRLRLPIGGADWNETFEYTQEYLNVLFSPIQLNSDNTVITPRLRWTAPSVEQESNLEQTPTQPNGTRVIEF